MVTGGFEVRGIAFPDIMKVNAMLAWRQLLSFQVDMHVVSLLGQLGSANILTLAVNNRDNQSTCGSFVVRGSCSKSRSQKKLNRRTSLFFSCVSSKCIVVSCLRKTNAFSLYINLDNMYGRDDYLPLISFNNIVIG